jgi:AcrR family transcriptional regulator
MNRSVNTREQILDRAAHLLMSRGYSGFSYRDISSHLGVKNAAIHYHFPSKSDLAMALVGEYRQILRDQTSEFMAYGGPALPQLEGLLRFTELQCQKGQCICPVGAFAVDYNEIPDDVRHAMDAFLNDSVNWLTRVLESGREQQEFDFSGDPRTRAITILAALQGARQMARIHQQDILHSVMDQIRAELGIKR